MGSERLHDRSFQWQVVKTVLLVDFLTTRHYFLLIF